MELKLSDETSVKVSKAKESLHLLDSHRFGPVQNSLQLMVIHCHSFRADYIFQEHGRSLVKLEFLCFSI